MRMLAIISLLMPFCTLCCAQTNSVYNYKGKSMIRYFDIEEFKRKSTTSSGYDCVEGGMRVSYLKRYDSKDKVIGYAEWREGINTPYGYYYEYDLRGRLIHNITSFQAFDIGKECYYDTLGRTIKTIDHDIPYKFTLDAFIEKMKKEYGYDVEDRKKVNLLERDEGKEDLHRPWYEVLCTNEPNGLYGERFLIDGTTGETLYIERDVYIDREGDGKYIEDMLAGRPVTIQEKYLYEQKKKKEEQDKKGTKKKGKSFWRKLFD